MRFLLILLASVAVFAAEPVDIVRRSIAAQAENEKLARNYTFIQRTQEFDGKTRHSKTHDVTMLEGSSYRRLIERDDRALPAEEEKAEQEKLRRSIEERRHETEAQRAQRLADYNKRPGRNRAMLQEIPDAFDFHLRGEELIDSRAAYVVDATPKAGYLPKTREGRLLLPNLKATLWIDKADYNWVRLDAEVIDTVSYGWFLLRLAKGAHVHIEQHRVNDEVWVPRKLEMAASARVGLVKKLNLEQELTFRNYRKFQSDSQMYPAQAGR